MDQRSMTTSDLPVPVAVMDHRTEEGRGKRVTAEGARTAPVTPGDEAVLVEAIILMRDYPQWAIWLPASGGGWTAIRPASSRLPSPELPTIWVDADTASELARLMRSTDEQVSDRDDPDH
jgi:hypothetical protein